MRNIIIIFVVAIFSACTQTNEYSIKVAVENAPDSIMVHNHWYVTTDTMPIVDGICTFEGVVDSFPTLVSIGFPFPSHETKRMILEPGNIEISYSPEVGFKLGGTENNIILQELFEELKPLEDEVKLAWKKWNDANKRVPRSKEECEKAWLVQEDLKKRKDDLTRKLIKGNPNYAGLVISLPIARYESADNLGIYVEQFKQYTGDKRYENIVKQYEIALKTVSGQPVPNFSYPNPNGDQISLSDFKGKWVLLDFWYVDCHWCRKLTPHLIKIYKDWKETRDFEIISISVDKPKDYDRWLEAIQHDGALWTQVNDSTKTYPLEYGITGYPTMILVDPDGNGVRKIIGYQEENGLRRILEEYVK